MSIVETMTNQAQDSTPTWDDVAVNLRPLFNRLILLYYRQNSASDLSTAQVSILTVLGTSGAMRVSDIAKAEAIRMPTASNAVHQLEADGMVQRERDPADRRGVQVALTAKGRKALDKVNDQRNKEFADFLRTLGDDAIDQAVQLTSLLEQLLARHAEREKE